MAREHRGYGIAFPSPASRVAVVDEALTVIRKLWTGELVNFSGEFFTLEDALCEPKPLQFPHPPIVIAGTGQRCCVSSPATPTNGRCRPPKARSCGAT
nr:LLM class flavin-dependent oxidoreductase [Mycobacterium kansasii]